MNFSHVTRAALTLMLAGMAAGVVKAEDAKPKWFVGGSLLTQLDSAKNVTNSTLGYGLNLGMDFQFTGYTFRAGFGATELSGSSRSGAVYENFAQDADTGDVYAYGAPTAWTNKTSLRNYQFFGDFIIPSGYEKLDFTFGVSLNRWFYNATVTPDNFGAYTVTGHTKNDHIPGLKGGLRIGAEYRFTKNLSAELLFQIVELGNEEGGKSAGTTDGTASFYYRPAVDSAASTQVTIANPNYMKLTHGSNENPSWVQIGVKYHF